MLLNSLPKYKIKEWLKVFADSKIDLTQKLKFSLERIQNIVEKGKMLVKSISSFSHNVFYPLTQKILFFEAFIANAFNLD